MTRYYRIHSGTESLDTLLDPRRPDGWVADDESPETQPLEPVGAGRLSARVPRYLVTGDHMRMVYSRHCTEAAATRAAKKLAGAWGWSHPGAEPRVIDVETGKVVFIA